MSHAKALNRREFLGRSAVAGESLLACPEVLSAANLKPGPGSRTAGRGHRGRPMIFLDGQPYPKPIFETDVPGLNRRIRLPKRSDVCNPFTGQRLWHRVTEFERNFQAKETVIWRVV